MINVTKSFLPPWDDYSTYLARVWESGIITNRGPLALELESKLSKRFSNDNILFVGNGTIALQLLFKLHGLKGEVITTPFSYVATTSSLIWEGLKPVFVDINKDDFCIDPEKIESSITDKTTAILGTHVFGNPCDIEKIQEIAQKYNLKVIYDAAHAFDVSYKGKSVLNYGDGSTLSFHATKVFHTGEGGAVVLNQSTLFDQLKLFHSFGHKGNDHILCGINGKNSELHAAMGLANFGHVEKIIEGRKKVCYLYDEAFVNSSLKFQTIREGASKNYSYYPVVLPSENILLKVITVLEKNNIFPRRYFYPSLNKLPYVEGSSCPISEDLASRILCLPLYPDLPTSDVHNIASLIKGCLE